MEIPNRQRRWYTAWDEVSYMENEETSPLKTTPELKKIWSWGRQSDDRRLSDNITSKITSSMDDVRSFSHGQSPNEEGIVFSRNRTSEPTSESGQRSSSLDFSTSAPCPLDECRKRANLPERVIRRTVVDKAAAGRTTTAEAATTTTTEAATEGGTATSRATTTEDATEGGTATTTEAATEGSTATSRTKTDAATAAASPSTGTSAKTRSTKAELTTEAATRESTASTTRAKQTIPGRRTTQTTPGSTTRRPTREPLIKQRITFSRRSDDDDCEGGVIRWVDKCYEHETRRPYWNTARWREEMMAARAKAYQSALNPLDTPSNANIIPATMPAYSANVPMSLPPPPMPLTCQYCDRCFRIALQYPVAATIPPMAHQPYQPQMSVDPQQQQPMHQTSIMGSNQPIMQTPIMPQLSNAETFSTPAVGTYQHMPIPMSAYQRASIDPHQMRPYQQMSTPPYTPVQLPPQRHPGDCHCDRYSRKTYFGFGSSMTTPTPACDWQESTPNKINEPLLPLDEIPFMKPPICPEDTAYKTSQRCHQRYGAETPRALNARNQRNLQQSMMANAQTTGHNLHNKITASINDMETGSDENSTSASSIIIRPVNIAAMDGRYNQMAGYYANAIPTSTAAQIPVNYEHHFAISAPHAADYGPPPHLTLPINTNYMSCGRRFPSQN